MFFTSFISILGSFKCDYPQEVVKNEPMLFNCDRESAYKLGGVITKNFMDNLPENWKDCDIVVDSRVHMLMPKWYPCIPGFHHDDVPRNKDQYGQPNYLTPEYDSVHLMGLVNGDICPTQFALGQIYLELPEPHETVYEHWHKAVDAACNSGRMFRVSTESGAYTQFTNNSFHQGVEAVGNGWRWFIRVSKNTDRTKNCTNELRRQVQVYLENPIQGW